MKFIFLRAFLGDFFTLIIFGVAELKILLDENKK